MRSSFSGVGDLGDLWIRELPNAQFAALTITAPTFPRTAWTGEEQESIASQPNREERLKVMHELASTVVAGREEILKYQDIVLNGLLKNLLGDPEVAGALLTSLGTVQ